MAWDAPRPFLPSISRCKGFRFSTNYYGIKTAHLCLTPVFRELMVYKAIAYEPLTFSSGDDWCLNASRVVADIKDVKNYAVSSKQHTNKSN